MRQAHYVRTRSAWQIALALAICFAVSGCGSLYFHSATRQKQGEAAVKAWEEVDTKGLFAIEQQNLRQLLDAELNTQARVASSLRNHLANVIVSASSVKEGVIFRAQKGLNDLATSREKFEQAIKLRDQTISPRSKVSESAVALLEANSPVRSCDDLDDGRLPALATTWLSTLKTGVSRESMRAELSRLEVNCAALSDAESKADEVERDLLKGSILGRALQQLDEDKQAVNAKQVEFAAQKSVYEAALKAHQTAVAESASVSADKTVSAKVAATAASLKSAVDTLDKLGNAFSKTFIAGETIDSIDAALKTIIDSSGKDAPMDASKAVVVAVQLPTLIDHFRQATADAKKPLVLPLLIRRNHEQIKLDAAATDAKGLKAKVALSEAIVAATRDEALALRKVLDELSSQKDGMAPLTHLPLGEAIAKGTPRQKQLLYSATARYLDSVGRLQGERYRLDYMRIGNDHDRSLAYSQASVSQWSNLIGSGVAQVNDFASGGITQDLLTDIAKILSVLWIGHGVNK